MSTPKSHRSHESQLEFGPTNPFVVQILASEADNVDEIKLSLSLLTPPTLPANISTLRWFTFCDGKLQRQQKHDAIEEEKNKCVLNDKAWQSHKTSNRTSPGGRSQTDIDTDTSTWLNMNMKKKQKLWAFYYSESRVSHRRFDIVSSDDLIQFKIIFFFLAVFSIILLTICCNAHSRRFARCINFARSPTILFSGLARTEWRLRK